MSFAINRSSLSLLPTLSHQLQPLNSSAYPRKAIKPVPKVNPISPSTFHAPLKFFLLTIPLNYSSLLPPPLARFPISVVKKEPNEVICKREKERAKMVVERECKALIFTYGTLKRGFSNHTLLQDLIRTGDAVFVGKYRTAGSYPLVCGPYRVPFLINLPGVGHRVQGELYALSSRGLARTDELEGTNRGHYERLPVELVEEEADEETAVMLAEAYFAHRSYGMEMWRKEGKKKGGGGAMSAYSEKEAKGYVKRKDRPQNLSFLDHIRLFLSSSSSSSASSD